MPRPAAARHRSRSWLHPLARVGRPDDGPGDVFDEPGDRVSVFDPAVRALRLGTVGVSLVLGADALARTDRWAIAWCAAVILYAAYRSRRPLRIRSTFAGGIAVALEVGVHTLAVIATGQWASPLVFSLVTAVTIAGLSSGITLAVQVTILSALTVSVPGVLDPPEGGLLGSPEAMTAMQWSTILLLTALIAGYTRRISGEADRQHSLALQRLGRLSDANALLFSLHRITQTLPASLDMGEVLDTTMTRLRGLFDMHAVAILVFDETDGHWQVQRRERTDLPARLGPTELPEPLKRAIAGNRLVEVPELAGPHGPGISPRSRTGLYSVLAARGQIIGLIAIEHDEPGHYTARDVELLNGFIEPAALAIDNARWFSRLRTVGADEERTRIARDLHDRIGQSLAYIAFELDRIVSQHQRAVDVGPALDQLRTDVRGVIGEVRETLYDLRTDVSDANDFAATIEAFVPRFEQRSGLRLELHVEQTGRLPILQERELWRIAQESLVNVERHAQATTATVRWWCDGRRATLEVSDDGRGFPVGAAGRADSYGIVGMRERAASIGASFEIVSEEGHGALVRCALGAPHA